MSYTPRIVVPGIPLHVTQRGVRRTNVFRDDDDRRLYLRILRQASRLYDLIFYAYCLMTNHVHFVVVPNCADSLWKTFHRLNSLYAAAFNARYGLVGHVWERRPLSTVTDESHLWNAVRYVECNPVRAGMVVRAEQYEWSSARFHCGLVSDDLLDTSWPPKEALARWSEWVNAQSEPTKDEYIREQTLSGKPCGDSDFVISLERTLGRRIRPEKAGRKPRSTNCDQPSLID